MERFHLLLLFCSLTSLFALTFSLRFTTYNIQSGSNYDHVYNLTNTARTIDQLNVDVIALQEVDNITLRHPIDQTTFIAKYNVDQPFHYYHFEKMRNFQTGGYGIAILAKQTSIQRTLTFHYSNTTADQCAVQKDGDYCQGIIMTEIPIQYPGFDFISIFFGTTHLGIGLNGSQQFNEAKQLVQWISDQIVGTTKNPYLILMTGDYNSIPSEETIKNVMSSMFDDIWLSEHLCEKIIDPQNINGYTFDSLNPSKRIDYFFLKKSENFPTGIKLNCQIQVIRTLSSDHRPVVLDLQLPSK